MVQLVLHSNWSGFRITTSQASAFSPCNITGFFRIHDSARDPLRIGSTGVGVALGTGVTTIVSLRRTRHPRIVARFNNDQLTTEAVSIKVARRYCELDGRSWHIQVSHESGVPSGFGYGTSGAGALGLSLALNEAMGLSLSRPEAAQLAHLCEVECQTGLWTGPHSDISSGRFPLEFHGLIANILELCRTSVISTKTSHECTRFVWFYL